MTQAPRAVELDGFFVIGREVRTSNKREANPAHAKIAALWQRFHSEHVAESIHNRVNPGVCFGVYTNYEDRSVGDYSVIAGVEVSGLDEIPKGMVGVEVPKSKYFVFDADGEAPEAIIDAWDRVHQYFRRKQSRRRTFGADFEIYDMKLTDHAEIYVSVQ